MSRVLLVTNASPAVVTGGRPLLCKLNRHALTDIFGSALLVVELPQSRVISRLAAAKAFLGHIDGIDANSLEKICALVDASSVRQVFIDGSNLGEAASVIKSRFPGVEVITFFHNVEARFFLGALRQAPGVRTVAVMLANYLAERKAVRNSDKLVCLSERDRRLLGRLYGRPGTHVAPMALQDASTEGSIQEVPEEKFALFVGGAFYANQAGIAWYAEHVAPHVQMKTYVVGHGFEKLKAKLERFGNIEVIGSVPSLARWYRRAHVVVAPIFDGSGMKTKVAEALMFGKRVVGTPEAFSGYEDVAPEAGEICRNASEFVSALTRSLEVPFCPMHRPLRSLYERNYSYPAARQRLLQILTA